MAFSTDFLTEPTSMHCPHGGTVIVATSNTKVTAAGGFVLRATDTFLVAQCPNMRGPQPNPCVRVKWDVHAEEHTTQGDPPLNLESVGYCLDGSGATQGTVMISSTQGQGAGA
jgi:hypothetical protein